MYVLKQVHGRRNGDNVIFRPKEDIEISGTVCDVLADGSYCVDGHAWDSLNYPAKECQLTLDYMYYFRL